MDNIISKLFSAIKPGDSDHEAKIPAGWYPTVGLATSAALEADKLVLVKIHADWCGYCQAFDDEISSLQHLKNYVDQHFVCAWVNEKSREGKKFIKTHKITGYPYFLVYSSSGKFIGLAKGYQSAASLISSLKNLVKEQKS